ncbi:OV-16 antigen [Trichonephila clavata]|uniref:OV-16 antigen n=1 Tax=Trichonephila clavata TaxID=2740835 RepID=A0A8X6L6Z5_TRICU|nr:OV-16 antigen [Trichonephila clavata]
MSSLFISSLQGACDLKKFREKGIVPNIIPDVPLSVIKVQYITESGIDCGVELNSTETGRYPGIEFKASNPDKLHTFVMFDPDAPTPQNPHLASFRNWVVEDIPGNRFYEGYTVSSFTPPNPPINSEAHRYIFLIYQQPKDEKLKESFDDGKRTHFKINTFVKNRNLIGPIAGNFLYVRH